MIRVERIWLATEALDMRSDADRMLARIIEVFGSAQPQCDPVDRCRKNIDGVGVWVALRRLNRRRFVWAAGQQAHFQLDAEQFQALVLGIAWQRVGSQGAISVV